MSTHQKSLYLLVPSDNFTKLFQFLDLKTNWLYNSILLCNFTFLGAWGTEWVEKSRDDICCKLAEFESYLRCWFDIIRLLFNLQTCISKLFQNRSQNILKLCALNPSMTFLEPLPTLPKIINFVAKITVVWSLKLLV